MPKTAQVLKLLEQKKELLMRYEQQTLRLHVCPTDEIRAIIRQRQAIINEADALDEKLSPLLADLDCQGHLSACLRGDLAVAALEEALRPVYQGVTQVRAIVTRLLDLGEQTALRLHRERDEALEQIRRLNRDVGARVGTYAAGDAVKSHITNA